MNIKVAGIIFAVLIVSGFFAYKNVENNRVELVVTSFDECVEAGNPIAESWPEQCWHNGEHFVRNIGNELEKTDLIRIYTPRPTAEVESPLIIEGVARGYWFFEATAPVLLLASEGLIVGEGYIQAEGDWMTEDFVPFSGVIEFNIPSDRPHSNDFSGSLYLSKANASGLPEYDDELEVPILFKQ